MKHKATLTSQQAVYVQVYIGDYCYRVSSLLHVLESSYEGKIVSRSQQSAARSLGDRSSRNHVPGRWR